MHAQIGEQRKRARKSKHCMRLAMEKIYIQNSTNTHKTAKTVRQTNLVNGDHANDASDEYETPGFAHLQQVLAWKLTTLSLCELFDAEPRGLTQYLEALHIAYIPARCTHASLLYLYGPARAAGLLCAPCHCDLDTCS